MNKSTHSTQKQPLRNSSYLGKFHLESQCEIVLAHPVLLLRDPATMEAVVDSSSFHPTRGGKQITKLEVFTLDLKVVLFMLVAFVSTMFLMLTWIL